MTVKTPVRLAATAATVAAMLIALPGCSGSDQQYPAKVAEDFIHALADKDAEGSCELMADQNTPVKGDDALQSQCLSLVHSFFGDEDFDAEIAPYAKAKVETVAVDGNEAEMEPEHISGVPDPDLSLELRLIEDLWYVTDIS